MKNYYKISEISKLYDIGVDSLRYYERLGILAPKRDTNGYRLYDLTDLYKLNIIRDLRSIDFSMAQIKDYLDQQSIANTIDLLHKEQLVLDKKLKEIQTRQEIIEDRIAALNATQGIQTGTIQVKELPARFCVRLNEYITRDEEMDFIIKKLHQKHEDKIRDLGNLTICAHLSMKDMKIGRANVYNSVFFILEQDTSEYDFELPTGKYLSCFYRGNYEQNAKRVHELLDYAHIQGLHVIGEPFETYTVDNRDTILPEEFLTEIQVQIEV
ncbi:MAG: MerR family transcriptional regulator [Dorea sp.]